MIQFYKKNGLVIYFLLVLFQCYDVAYNKSENGYYLKGLEFLSIVLFLSMNLTKRHHNTSKWIIYSAIVLFFGGSFLNEINTLTSIFFGYVCQGITFILFAIFMHRLTKKQELSNKEPIISGVLAAVVAIILFTKTKVEFPPYTYFAYGYALVLVIMLMTAVNLLGIKNKNSIAFKALIPATVVFMASGVLLVVNHLGTEKYGFNIVVTTITICTYSAFAMFIDGAKKILK